MFLIGLKMNELVMFAAFAFASPPPLDFSAFPPAPSGVNPLTPAKTRRVRVAGYWWDELPNGTLRWCESCNGPYPAAGVPGMVVVDWNGYRPPAPAVFGRPGG
jgi:hypothetical protein